jgi:hypothetical protein
MNVLQVHKGPYSCRGVIDRGGTQVQVPDDDARRSHHHQLPQPALDQAYNPTGKELIHGRESEGLADPCGAHHQGAPQVRQVHSVVGGLYHRRQPIEVWTQPHIA